MTGAVYLVGAGPGDPRLITLRGTEVLRTADVVIHDRLASAALLDLAPSRAELIDVGKARGFATRTQEEINRLLVARALEGNEVVRLKGGDPFVFGRGGEEALACAEAGVPVEIVPGVTSAVAAPASIGIPLSHRGLASSVAILTASTADGDADLRAAAGSAETLVILMAADRLEQTCRSLIEGGRPPNEPAAVVASATTSDQRSVVSTLADLPKRASETAIASPATVVVGPVVRMAEHLAGVLGDPPAADAPGAATSGS
jgi:uroporphyrin-III C-methyltransferase